MKITTKDFYQLYFNSKVKLLSTQGTMVSRRTDDKDRKYVLYSLNNFFVEGLLDMQGDIMKLEVLNLEEVAEWYCGNTHAMDYFN